MIPIPAPIYKQVLNPLEVGGRAASKLLKLAKIALNSYFYLRDSDRFGGKPGRDPNPCALASNQVKKKSHNNDKNYY